MNKYVEGTSDNFKKFFLFAEEYLKKHKIKLNIRPVKFLRDGGIKYGGSFDGDDRILKMAIGTDYVFQETFVHEFCHVQQFVEKSPLWDCAGSFFDDLNAKKVNLKSWECVWDLIQVERDCEARALRTVKKWDLMCPIGYAQRANIYLFYYQYAFVNRKWVNPKSLYQSIIVEAMPKTIVPLSRLKKIDMRLMQLYDTYSNEKKV